jgi:hypothetical protein
MVINANVKWMLLSAAALLFFSGCKREPVQVYTAPKEDAAKAPVPSMPAGHGDMMGGAPAQIAFKLPAGWKEKTAAQMRAAQFSVSGPDSQEADVSVIPLPGMSASHEDLLNIWREQVQLAPVSKEDADKALEKVTIAGLQGNLADMVSEKNLVNDRFKLRILVASVEKAGTTWFIKMTGPDELVKASRPSFLEFLQGLTFKEAAEAPAAMPAMGTGLNAMVPAGDAGENPKWKVPADWQEAKAGPMQSAKFIVIGENGKQAEITVSSLGGDGGGLLANANRWRGQLLLKPVSEEEMAKDVQKVAVGAAQAIMMDIKGTSAKSGEPARMVVLSVPDAGKTWFYKLLGEEKLVEKQKDAFVKFAGSAQ